MTRAFTPPESLSKEDIRTLGDVRRDIWTNAFEGMATGALTGIALHSVAQFGERRGYVKNLKLSGSTALFSVLAGGAMGSYIMATTTGKNEVHNLHPIFEAGKEPENDDYRQSLLRAQQREEELKERHRNRVLRRASLRNTLERQHGISDSHGGHWVAEEEKDEREHNRLVRRKSMQDNLRHGKGLSDSHGGRWA